MSGVALESAFPQRLELKARVSLAFIFSALGTLYWHQEGLPAFIERSASSGWWRVLNCLGASLPFAIVGFGALLGRFWQRLPDGRARLNNPSNLVVNQGRESGNFGCWVGCLSVLAVPVLGLFPWLGRACETLVTNAPWFLLGLLGVGLWISFLRRHWIEVDRESGHLIDHLTLGGLQFSKPRQARVAAVVLAFPNTGEESGDRVVTFLLDDASFFQMPPSPNLTVRHLYQLGLAYRVPVLEGPARAHELTRLIADFRRDPGSVKTLSLWGSVYLPDSESVLDYGSLPPLE